MKFFSEMECIEVPQYVSEIFNKRPPTDNQTTMRTQQMYERINRLVSHALEGLPNADWEILNSNCRSPKINEPLGLERDDFKTYVYGEERGRKSPIAIFKDSSLAADYFVWLVSKGKREINWQLFVDVEP